MSQLDLREEQLIQEIQRLEQENKTLNLRAQGVEVLGKVLQESKDENSKLKEEVYGLKEYLINAGVDVSQFSIQTTPSLQQTRCFLSKPEDRSISLTGSSMMEPFEFVPSVTATNNTRSNSATIPEFHIKDLTSGFKVLKDQSELLLQQANQLLHCISQNVPSPSQKTKLLERISFLLEKLEEHVKDAKTREMLLRGLSNEEEQLKEKVLAMEHEQVSQEQVMEDLKAELEHNAEELANIQQELNIFTEAEFVSKSDISLESTSSKTTASSATSSKSSSLLSKNEKQENPEAEVSKTKPSCTECLEVKQQLHQTLKQKKELERQKEEILDVNHAWDLQYKKLKTETGKEITDLRQQVEFFKTSDNQKKFESLRNSYKKVIDDERKLKEQALNEKMKIEEKCKSLEDENRKLSVELTSKENKPLASALTPQSSLLAQHNEHPDVKEIEILKQQIRVYADDFKCERMDRERMQSEKEYLEKKLKESEERITVLEEQLHLYEEDFRKETQEKDRLRRQLLTSNRETIEPETQYSEMTRQTQAIAEHQARLRSLREQYEREERRLLMEQQELQQRTRTLNIHPESEVAQSYRLVPRREWHPEPLRARGARPPDNVFYGGDVQADSRRPGREVPDGVKTHEFSCPRCFRSFPQSDIESYSKHVEKCIE